MPPPQDDDVARGGEPAGRGRPAQRPGTAGRPAAGPVNVRAVTLAGGFTLAVAATTAVFLTENRQYLQLAVIAMAWAFVLAAFAAGRRGSDRATAEAREAQLRQAYELELEREVAARREYELDLEHDLRREAEDAMREELDSLRAEIASLGRLREDVARVSDLRHDLAGLSALRDDVARLAALREDVAALGSLRQDVAALGSLRQDLGQLAELRADMGRLRAELTEQLSSEMLVERIVMRTQGGRFPVEPGRPDAQVRPMDVSASWSDDTPPRELTGGWPAIRLDDPRDLRPAEQVRVDRSLPEHTSSATTWSTGPGTSAFASPTPPPPAGTGSWRSVFDRPAPPPAVPPVQAPPVQVPPSPWTEPRPAVESRSWDEPRPWRSDDGPAEQATTWSADPFDPVPSRHSAQEPPLPPPVQAHELPPPVQAYELPPPPPSTTSRPSPAPRPSPRPRPTPPPPSARLRPELPPLRRRSDEADAEASTGERPVTPTGPPPAPGPTTHAAPGRDGAPAPAGDSGTDGRLAEILAENGVSGSTGGRRRRRYRDEGESDDVLARVLGLG